LLRAYAAWHCSSPQHLDRRPADGIITISGERKLEREDQGENAIRIESVYGAFARSFVLPDSADANGIHAESKDGVLRIHVPKTKTKKSEPVAIEVH
jgi:HSP20 family protein